jgi:hypothetical protein
MRECLVTLPEHVKILRWRLRSRLERAVLRLVDRYLAGRGEERTVVLLDFEEIPVLFDEADFGVLSAEGM